MRFFILAILVLCACAHKTESPNSKPSVSPIQPWIEKSDRVAEEFTRALAGLHPEVGSEIGYTEFDRLGFLLSAETEEMDRALFNSWIERLNTEIAKTEDPELKTDFDVLQNWLRNQVANIDIFRTEREVAFTPGTQVIYQNLQTLISAQTASERKLAAVERFKVYVHGDANHRPLLTALQEQFKYQQKKYRGKKALFPFRGEVEQYLKDSNSYVTGTGEMLKSTGNTDWSTDWEIFKKQAADYDQFIKKDVLPASRKDPRVPKAIYAQILRRREIQSTPAELIQTGLSDYKKIYADFRREARIMAEKYKLPKSDPASVIRFLKSKPVTNPQEVEQLYKQADQRLEKLIRDNKLISLPSIPLQIRMADEVESKSQPIPHLNPPPLVNNHGERPEFIVPSSNGGLPFDDFSSPHSAMILTAHEGRPGHDLQFSRMLDSGLSVIRSRYAANNVNIEGWALYAEDLVYPYLTPEEKLFALQTRLWRVARMFLDPQLQLGKINDQRVIDVFTKELGVSEAMAKLEVRRYKFGDIGQAPAYYEGYLLVKKMRAAKEKQLGADFNLMCFNDQLIAYGLLPLRISAIRMQAEHPCAK